MKKAEIKKIVIDLGEKDVEMSLDQAKQLHKMLNEMFGAAHVITSHYPVYIDRYRPYWCGDMISWSSGNGLQMTYTSDTQTMNVNLEANNVLNEAHKLVDAE